MYYNPNRQKVHDVKTKLYVAKYLDTIQDENFNQKKIYDIPKPYMFNVQNVTLESEISEFGELVNSMKVAVVTEKQRYLNTFDEFDLAYLDGATPKDEVENGDNANYRIYAIRKQNTIIRIYFLKLVINNQ